MLEITSVSNGIGCARGDEQPDTPAPCANGGGCVARSQKCALRVTGARRRAPQPRTRTIPPCEKTPDDRGAVTAEYAIVIMAAVAFAGVLVAIMGSGEVRALLVGLIQNALGAAG